MGNLYISIQALQQRLRDAGVSSIVIGGVAVGVWGEPRLTRDADLKVLLERKDADRLLSILNSDYVSLLPDPQAAIRRQAMLFVQDVDGIRLDLLLADTPYDVSAVAPGALSKYSLASRSRCAARKIWSSTSSSPLVHATTRMPAA